MHPFVCLATQYQTRFFPHSQLSPSAWHCSASVSWHISSPSTFTCVSQHTAARPISLRVHTEVLRKSVVHLPQMQTHMWLTHPSLTCWNDVTRQGHAYIRICLWQLPCHALCKQFTVAIVTSMWYTVVSCLLVEFTACVDLSVEACQIFLYVRQYV